MGIVDTYHMKEIKVITPLGEGIIGGGGMPALFISELGYIVCRVYLPEQEVWVKYKLCDLKDVLHPDLQLVPELAPEII